MTETVDCAVIGAGVVGLAVARALALAGREVIVLEAADAIGTETSSRNSEVIHAGIYYPTGTLKAKLCVAGRDFLYRFAAERGIEHKRCGKLIVATSEDQLPYLKKIHDQAQANGVSDLQPIGGNVARTMEPNLRCHAALLSPSTGIIDSHSLMLAYQGDAEARGAVIAFNSAVRSGRVGEDGIELEVGSTVEPDAEPMRLSCRSVVNSAGLHAQELARHLAGLKPDFVPPTYYAKGNYFQLLGKAPFGRLVYPVPEKAGLGVHITLDLGGQARFGPDVEWIDQINYDVDPRRCQGFYAEIRKYWPELPDGALVPGYAGVRPKIGPSGAVGTDFVIQGPEAHGVPGLVNLFGIESPGLTASPAIAAEVATRLAA
ncbi:MAG TPA: NAD(P)/FAD-dependent oxidoreductase [Alphaproteobacteria bacterium]